MTTTTVFRFLALTIALAAGTVSSFPAFAAPDGKESADAKPRPHFPAVRRRCRKPMTTGSSGVSSRVL